MKKSENRNLSSDKPRLPEIPYFLYFFDILFFDFYFQDYCLDGSTLFPQRNYTIVLPHILYKTIFQDSFYLSFFSISKFKSIHGFDYYKTQSVKYYHCLSGANAALIVCGIKASTFPDSLVTGFNPSSYTSGTLSIAFPSPCTNLSTPSI